MVLGAMFLERTYTDKWKTKKEYQQGMALIQSHVTNYLVKNYEGIEKIEWQGVGVEWQKSPIYGHPLFENYIESDVRVFVSKGKYFTVRFTLSDETHYNNNLKKYEKSDSMTDDNTDFLIQSDFEDATCNLNQKEKEKFNQFKKSPNGSSSAKVIYNLDIHKLKY